MPNFILVNKPAGITSHDVVDYLRRITHERRIGHAGTLDPFAEGLLILGIGRESTRELGRFLKMGKEYIATLHLGAVSDTYDKTGKITDFAISGTQQVCLVPDIPELKNILQKFVGEIEQLPPMYSAKKVGGKKLYELARAGKDIERKPAKIKIYSIKFLEYNWPLCKICVQCGSGTYIRSLAHDIGRALGCGAYLEELERTRIGKYNVQDAHGLEGITKENWIDKIANFS